MDLTAQIFVGAQTMESSVKNVLDDDSDDEINIEDSHDDDDDDYDDVDDV